MCDIVGGGVKNSIVFGELMCNNNIKDYTKSGLNGRVIMFGAVLMLEDDENMNEYLENLRGNGFVVKKVKSVEICIYLNEKITPIFEKLSYDCRMEMVKRSTIFDVRMKNKTKIVYGEIEGVVILTDIGYLK